MSARRRGFWSSGDPFVWLTGGAVAFSLLMVAGLVLLILVNGLGFFWPSSIACLGLKNGEKTLGQLTDRERVPGLQERYRLQVKQGNRELGNDFRWIDEDQIESREAPRDAVVVERREWGPFMGFLREVKSYGKTVATGAEAWTAFQERLPAAEALHD
jgi:phosphate transport system permease protein